VCELSPKRAGVDAVLHDVNSSTDRAPDWTYRVNPKTLRSLEHVT
jgi:hypothetical protein